MQKITKISPFPGVGRALFERGSGGMGDEKYIQGQGKLMTPGQAPRSLPQAARDTVPCPAQSQGCKGR